MAQLQIGSKATIKALVTLLDQQIHDKFNEYKAADFKINNVTKVSFDTCYSAMVALDLVRHGNWMRPISMMSRIYLATREYEGENAK